MDNNNVKVEKKGLGIFSILTIIFVILKAFGIINFTWFQCLLPLIIGIGLTLVVTILGIIAIIFLERY